MPHSNNTTIPILFVLWALASQLPRRLLLTSLLVMTVDGMLAVVSVVLLIPIVTLFAGQTTTELNGLSAFGLVEAYRNEIAEFGLVFFFGFLLA